MLLGAEVARASTEVSEASGAARFEASTAMFRKVRETAAKVPLVGPSVSNAAENLEDALDGDEQDAPPVPAPPPETSGPALASSLAPRSSLAASQPHENRPASGAFLLLLGGLLIGFVAIVRRK